MKDRSQNLKYCFSSIQNWILILVFIFQCFILAEPSNASLYEEHARKMVEIEQKRKAKRDRVIAEHDKKFALYSTNFSSIDETSKKDVVLVRKIAFENRKVKRAYQLVKINLANPDNLMWIHRTQEGHFSITGKQNRTYFLVIRQEAWILVDQNGSELLGVCDLSNQKNVQMFIMLMKKYYGVDLSIGLQENRLVKKYFEDAKQIENLPIQD